MYVEATSGAFLRAPQGSDNKRPFAQSPQDLSDLEQERESKRVNIDVHHLTSNDSDTDSFHQHSSIGPQKKIHPNQLRLRECIERRSIDGVRSCIQEGARLDRLISPEGMLPLNAAITMNSETGISMAKLMISQDPSCVNFSCEDSVSPLFAAYTTRNVALVRFLLDYGADPFLSCTQYSPSLFEFIEGMSEFNEPPRHAQETLRIIEDWRANKDRKLGYVQNFV